MQIYVGTSGWLYSWNIKGTLDWYVNNSGLNAVELNSSFYRYPFPNQVKSWRKKGDKLRWTVKVHRGITHYRQLTPKSYESWDKFRALFKPLEQKIDYYLLQLPPRFNCREKNMDKLVNFINHTGIQERIAVEYRNKNCFNNNVVMHSMKNGYTLVSIDAPIASWIVKTHSIIYLRLHGRTDWYNHYYSIEELTRIAEAILSLEPSRVYVFLNNNHWMLENAVKMLQLLSKNIYTEKDFP